MFPSARKRWVSLTLYPSYELYAVYPPTRHLSVKVRLFIDFLVERFGREEEVAGGRRKRAEAGS